MGVIPTRHQAYHFILSYHRRVRVQIQSEIQISHPCYFCRNQNTANWKKKLPQAIVSVTIIHKYKTWWNEPIHKPENLSSLALTPSRRQKGEKTFTTPSHLRPDCSQLNKSLSYAPVTSCEQRYLKGDYQRTPLGNFTPLFPMPRYK